MKERIKKNIVIIFTIIAFVLIGVPASAQQTSIDNGLFYLYSTQDPDGSWGGTEASLNTVLQTTAATAKTLQLMRITDISLTNSIGYLSAQTPNNVDDIAMQLEVLSSSGTDVTSLIASLKSAQQADGGWGIDIDKTYQSDIIDTLSAINSLKAAGAADATTASNAINYLLSNQNADGGWGIIKDSPSEIFYTSLAFLVLNDFKRSFNLTSSLSSAGSYLLSRQNLDGSFGASIFETAMSFQALTRSTLDLISRSAAISYLISTQLPDGSWDEDPYSTALALRALSDSGIISSAQINPINLTKVIDGISQPASTYLAYETMTIGVTTADPDVLLEVTVQDSSGTVYSTRTEGGEIFFDTSNLSPGTYTLIVQAIDPETGIIIDETTTTFSIEATIAITDASLMLIPQFTHVGATETVSIFLFLSSRSNATASLTIEHEVKTPSGIAINSGITSLSLSPDMSSTTVTLSTFNHSFTESGKYPIQAKVLNGAVLLTTADSSISAAPLVRIDPTKTISPTTVTPDGDKRIRISIHLEGVEEGGSSVTADTSGVLFIVDPKFSNRIVSGFPHSGFQNTGITVKLVDRLKIKATGTACTIANIVCFGPNGDGAPPPANIASTFLAPTLSGASLVGRIENEVPFFVGSDFDKVINESGTVYLGFNDSRVDDNSGFFEVRINVMRPVVDIHIIDTISTSNIDLDSTSFSKQPYSITADTANNKTIIEWQYDSFSIGQIEDISFDVILKNPIPGEDRIVNHKLELLYTDVNGNDVRTELGSQSVHVLASAFTTSVLTDKTEYTANENAQIGLSITNLSEYGRTIDAILEIKDIKGNLVSTVKNYTGLSFVSGETKSFQGIIWNTGSTPSGDYQALVRLMEGTTQVGEAKTSFTILPSKSASSKIVSDKTAYSSNETVTLTSTVTSQSQNSTITKLSASVKIIDPNGISIFTETKGIPDLLPLAKYEFKSFTNTKTNPSGSYTATLEVKDGASLLISISSTSFTILSSLDQAKALSGTILVDPGTIFEKETTTLTYTIQNTGNDIDLPMIQIEILIVDPDTGLSVRTMIDETSLNGREVYINSILFDSTGLAPKSYLVVLRGITAGIIQTLSSTGLIINPIPNNAPIANAGPDQLGFTGQSVSLDGTLSSDPDGDTINFSWHFVSVPEGSLITDTSLISATVATPSFTPDVEGTYVLGLVANDGLFSSQEDRVSVFINPAPKVDLHPETINLKSNGGSKSITGILSSPLLSSYSFFTAQDGITVTASFTLENRYMDKDGKEVVFTIPQDDYTGDDYVMVSDSDGNGIDDTYSITLKFNRDLIIAGFKDANGLLKIAKPTDLISTIIGNNIRIGSDTNLVISLPEVK